MKKIVLFMLLFPLCLFSQDKKSGTLDAALDSIWSTMALDWKYHTGDNENWSKPGFDDSSWPDLTAFRLKIPDSVAVTDKNNIVWFRKILRPDVSLNLQLAMQIYQTGASEIYLNGKRIHVLGKVSSAMDSIEFYSPDQALLSFPLGTEEEQLLAVRYANAPSKFPLFPIYNYDGILIQLTTLDNAIKDVYLNLVIKRYYIVLGVAIFMFILFLSFFLFFPTEKINLYFALSNLFFALFLASMIILITTHERGFRFEFMGGFFSAIYVLLIYYCLYKVFDQKFGRIFRIILIIGGLSIPLLLLFDMELVTPLSAILILLDIGRISVKSLKTNKTGALIFLIVGGINFVFWIANSLDSLSVLNMPYLWEYQPYAHLLIPLGLAIYLGYSFGKRSQSLRLRLEEVEQLSSEKQEILANQNILLEKQVAERTSELKTSLEHLKSTQSQLIQSEKMASLGEVTAGIAHEIQNPLNFVNNFSEVSTELVDEINEEIEQGNMEDAKEIGVDLKQNLEKINHHGKRAGEIVKGMLQHSRTSSGQKEFADINALADEYLRLAYHGLRAKDKSFNATLETDFDEKIGKIEIIPQDIGRVILNLITNAFYAVNEKKKQTPEGYEPTVMVSTKKLDKKLEIIVSDNGNGIPDKVKEKIFQPFFTTKPTGKGTGLGLSLSYDIVMAHGGELKVKTNEGEGSEFIITLPI